MFANSCAPLGSPHWPTFSAPPHKEGLRVRNGGRGGGVFQTLHAKTPPMPPFLYSQYSLSYQSSITSIRVHWTLMLESIPDRQDQLLADQHFWRAGGNSLLQVQLYTRLEHRI